MRYYGILNIRENKSKNIPTLDQLQSLQYLKSILNDPQNGQIYKLKCMRQKSFKIAQGIPSGPLQTV